MSRNLLGLLFLPPFLLLHQPATIQVIPPAESFQQDPAPDFDRDVFTFLDNYCLYCHEGEEAEGNVDLALYLTEDEARQDPNLYWAAAWKVWDHAMPPPRRKDQPTTEERARFLAWVDSQEGLGKTPPTPAPVLRRMNRTMYRRSVEQLCGVVVPDEILASLPEDEAGDGFDNIGSALTLADDAVLRYLEAAEAIAALAVHDFDQRPQKKRWIGNELDAMNLSGNHAALWSNASVSALWAPPREGRYLLRVGAYGQQAGPDPCRMALELNQKSQKRFDVPSENGEETICEVELYLSAETHRFGASFLNDYYRPDLPEGEPRDRNLYISWMEVEGPLDPLLPTEFQRDLFARYTLRGTNPSLDPKYGPLLKELGQLAWRRPLTRTEVIRFTKLVAEERRWEDVVRLTLTALMTSPNFLFETTAEPERRSAARQRRLPAEELVTRLSFFLWGSIPDANLLAQAAAEGWAQDDQALRSMVEAMLQDKRSIALAEDFASQCFRIQGLEEHVTDQDLFPDTDAALLRDMREETMRLFQDVLLNNRDLRDLLTAEDSFVNQRLAKHYGLDWPEGQEGWVRVDLSDTPRRGVLGHASILTMTSLPNRTSPVRRGRWIMDNLLGAPPPPPPANAGNLDESEEASQSGTLRERLAAHRDKTECISCHRVMDPLGFSLERFDAVGRWRDQVQGEPVDAGGQLPDGTELRGLNDLVEVLDARDSFTRLMVQRLCSYALGRSLVPADRTMVQGVLDQLDPEHPTLRAAIHALVQSKHFRRRPQAPRAQR